MTVRAVPCEGGGHDIVADQYTRLDDDLVETERLVLVHVRPVGTLQWGGLSMFVTDWVPDLIEALQLARTIADRERPWEPYEPAVAVPEGH